MYLAKLENGDYRPCEIGDKELSNRVKVGEVVQVKKTRNYEFHKKGMKLLTLAFDNQDKYSNFEIFRQVLTMKAGFINWTEDKNGKPFPLPKSLSFENMDEIEFQKWYETIKEIVSKEIGVNNDKLTLELMNY